MVFLPKVISAKYEAAFRIRVTFNDGTEAGVDFQPWLSGPVFEPLKKVRTSGSSSLMAALSRGPTAPTSRRRRCTRQRRPRGLTLRCSRRQQGQPVAAGAGTDSTPIGSDDRDGR